MKRDFQWLRATHILTFCAMALMTASLAWGQNEAANQADEDRPQPSASPTEDAPPDADDERAREADRSRPDARESEEPSRRPTDPGRRDPSDERTGDRPGQPRDRQFLDREPRDEQSRESRGSQEESDRPRGLGLEIEEEGEGELTVSNVQPESAAARAGLRANDRILSADGRRFASARQFRAYLGGQFGRRVPVIIERNGRQYTVQFSPSGGGEEAWLGVYMQDDEDDQAGARVTHVYPTSPAARAGFRAGDVILEINGERVESAPDVIALVEEADPGSQAEFVVRRNDQEVDLTAKLGRRDAYVFFQNEQSRDPQGGESEQDDPYGRVPPYMMQLEHDRRMAEQHQRMEEAINQLREEVKQLREEITKQR